jgi:hypothetical protein
VPLTGDVSRLRAVRGHGVTFWLLDRRCSGLRWHAAGVTLSV